MTRGGTLATMPGWRVSDMTARHFNPPSLCDICAAEIVDAFYDFRTSNGRWANGCPACFKAHRGRTGTGMGQRYELRFESDGQDLHNVWIKTAG